MINLAAPKNKTEAQWHCSLSHIHTLLYILIYSLTYCCACMQANTTSHTHKLCVTWSARWRAAMEPAALSFGLKTRMAAQSRPQSPPSASQNPVQQESLQRDTDLGENASGIEHPYLCVRAIFSLLFSDFRCASAGPAWEAFSSSVPLTLDAWGEDGVSHTDSWPKCISSHVTAQPYSGSRSGVQKACVFHRQDSAWSCDVLLTLHM